MVAALLTEITLRYGSPYNDTSPPVCCYGGCSAEPTAKKESKVGLESNVFNE